MTESPRKMGWWKSLPPQSRMKYHYYNEKGMSLCGRYYLFYAPASVMHIDPEGYFIDSEDSCKTCSKKLKKLLNKEDQS